MKHRNPIFVAGFPYAMLFFGYIIIYGLLLTSGESDKLSDSAVLPLLGGFAMIIVSVVYALYWQIETARRLRRLTGQSIPPAILLIIPLANYWWFWRYSAAVEKYTKGKVQGILAFILLALLGSIGMGILQDYYNKSIRVKE